MRPVQKSITAAEIGPRGVGRGGRADGAWADSGNRHEAVGVAVGVVAGAGAGATRVAEVTGVGGAV
ncbi:hypothetical protein [Knoellia flava]|uniref:Uncharacterized protein n=1 Tax=Knoellia flava TaxID=913969 RepID=A0A8H9KUC1_9MICO|nr:hypothetical protein [Knoellia flava]GGB80400.1 hypothetical protein GCM10011314_20020 [Knoellia flava]